MVLEPLTALSVAGTVVQFTDFGIKLLTTGRELYISVDGILEQNREFEMIATDLKRLTIRIRESMTPLSEDDSLTKEGRTFERLTEECERVADVLLKTLDSLKIQPNDKRRKWRSFHQALKSMWSAERIEGIAKRLANARAQLDTHILVNMQETIDILSLRQSQLFETLNQSTRAIVDTLAVNRRATDKALGDHLHLANRSIRQDITEARTEIIDAIRLLDWVEWKNTSKRSEESIFEEMTEAQKKNVFKTYMYKSLSFRAMNERQEEIPEAHKSTFQWVYEAPKPGQGTWSDFSMWLSQGNGVYWIQGKPGSGKSCLMKYIYEQPGTKKMLLKWAGDTPLILAGFFFWYSGTSMQKSQQGLLRSLLYQILAQQPLLTPIAFPMCWHRFNETGERILTLSRAELMQATTRILSQTIFALRICIFIDGLDEYDGDHAEIVTLFKSVAASRFAKMCVSSRPWLIFKDAFGEYPTLKLQDLTKPDITRFAEETLGESKPMVQLQDKEPEDAASLIQDIVEKSSGVFLWVKLVVRSLMAGLMNHDHVSDLKKRLEQLPSDLEELYMHMLKRIDPFYLQQAIKLFRIVEQARRPLPSLVISFADSYDFEISPTMKIDVMANRDVVARCNEIEDKIQSRCLGLLECVNHVSTVSGAGINDDFSFLDNLLYCARFDKIAHTVQFMHRTVNDFLEKPQSWRELSGPLNRNDILYDANKALCFSSLIQLKQVFSPDQYGSWTSAYRSFSALVKECMEYAALVERSTNEADIVLMDELERTAAFHYDRAMKTVKMGSPKTTWVHTLLPHGPSDCDRQTMFLAFAIQYKLERYVPEKIEQVCSSSTPPDLQFLLDVALTAKNCSPRIIKALLAKGADPNQGDKGVTPWQKVLKQAWYGGPRLNGRKSSDGRIQQVHEIVEHFLCYDADPHMVCYKSEGLNEKALRDSLPALGIVVQMGNARVMALVLERGASPNQLHEGSTPWQDALRYVYQEVPKLIDDGFEDRLSLIHEWLKIYKLLLEYNANPRTFVSISLWTSPLARRPFVSVLTVIHEVFSKWDTEGASELQAVLPEGLAVELRQLQSQSMRPHSPTYPCSIKGSTLLAPEHAIPPAQQAQRKKRRSITELFSKFRI